MRVEVWAGNPLTYMKSCVEADLTNFIFDGWFLRGGRADVHALCTIHVRSPRPFEYMVVSSSVAYHHDRQHGRKSPKAIYPVWTYGKNSLEALEAMMHQNYASRLRTSKLLRNTPYAHWPPEDQPHRVIVKRLPSVDYPYGRKFRLILEELALAYPQCKLHIHGPGSSYQWNFGAGAKAVTINFDSERFREKLVLANGKAIDRGEAYAHARWVRMLGYRARDLLTAKDRVGFNIRGAIWASVNWESEKEGSFDSVTAELTAEDLEEIVNGGMPRSTPVVQRVARNRPAPPQVGDKFYCDTCSYASGCRAYRVGSVCTVKGSNAKELLAFFQTRNGEKIMRGLTGLMEIDLERLELGRRSEEESGQLDPNVSKLTQSLFAQGVQLAKIVDPSLRSPGVQVNVNSAGNTQVGIAAGSGGLPINTLAANAVAALEAAGVPRAQINSELVKRYLDADGDPDEIRNLIIEERARYALPVGLSLAEDPEVEDAVVLEDE